ncbi:uncharacterized protein CLUP02_10903 [Colletotrichum lupini]|uniref:Uncharacterized protein n=1 Tax=Colletotrichum lupini TaxID=145971 RepID=A0A9Q8SZ91_9PEZI|nr:uncharacterized protein CLUP02_10903 [Colletotrichum lupini]UQC85406.1 hypothetical protein CLUP02_10903 [Colletotrichum lupini]
MPCIQNPWIENKPFSFFDLVGPGGSNRGGGGRVCSLNELNETRDPTITTESSVNEGPVSILGSPASRDASSSIIEALAQTHIHTHFLYLSVFLQFSPSSAYVPQRSVKHTQPVGGGRLTPSVPAA